MQGYTLNPKLLGLRVQGLGFEDALAWDSWANQPGNEPSLEAGDSGPKPLLQKAFGLF